METGGDYLEPVHVGESAADEPAEEPVGWGVVVVALDLTPDIFHEGSESDARRTDSLTVAAEKTELHMLDESIGDADLSLRGGPNEVNPPPWSIHLVAEHEISGTGGQAEAAVHAVEVNLRVGGVNLIESPYPRIIYL